MNNNAGRANNTYALTHEEGERDGAGCGASRRQRGIRRRRR